MWEYLPDILKLLKKFPNPRKSTFLPPHTHLALLFVAHRQEQPPPPRLWFTIKLRITLVKSDASPRLLCFVPPGCADPYCLLCERQRHTACEELQELKPVLWFIALIRLNCHFLWFPPKLSLIISTCTVFIVAAARVQLAGNCCTVLQGLLFFASLYCVGIIINKHLRLGSAKRGQLGTVPLLPPVMLGAVRGMKDAPCHEEFTIAWRQPLFPDHLHGRKAAAALLVATSRPASPWWVCLGLFQGP